MYKALKDTDDAYRADGLVWRTELAGEPKVRVVSLPELSIGVVCMWELRFRSLQGVTMPCIDACIDVQL